MSSNLASKVSKAAPYVVIPSCPLKIDGEQTIWACLNKLGIYDDEISYELLMSKDCKEGDARAVFCETEKLPVPRFRKIWSILKEGSEEEKDESKYSNSSTTSALKEVIANIRPIGQLSNKELLDRYALNFEDSAVEEELKKRSCGTNCIAFIDKKTIDVGISASLIAKAKKGIKVPSVLKKDNKLYNIRPVGEFPQEAYDVCPVTGCLLFDGYSEELGITWTVHLEVKQFIWLMNDQGIKIDAFTANNIQKMAETEGFDAIKLQYPKITELYEGLSDTGGLPSLKEKLNSKQTQKIDPFRGNRRF